MNTLRSSVDNPLAFYARPKSPGARFLAALRTWADALADGLAASRTYHALIARGDTHEAAIAEVFDRHLRHR